MSIAFASPFSAFCCSAYAEIAFAENATIAAVAAFVVPLLIRFFVP
jgi:hypothetical protein